MSLINAGHGALPGQRGEVMSKQPEPLRGEAAWKAAKKEIAARNEAAYARGRRERAVRDAERVTRRREEIRMANTALPRQPQR